jgi:hypothetical protein
LLLSKDVLRRSARKSGMKRIETEHIKEIMGVKGKPDIIDIIEKKTLSWYGHVKRMPEERILKLILEWVPEERRKSGCPKKKWMEGVQAAITTRNLEPDQWRNSGGMAFGFRRTATAVIKPDGWMDGWMDRRMDRTDGRKDRQTDRL